MTIFPSHPPHFNANYWHFELLDCQHLQSSGWLYTCEGNTCSYHPEGSIFFPVKEPDRQKSCSALLPHYSRFLTPCPFKSLPALKEKPFSPADWIPDTFYKAISVGACAIFKLVCHQLHHMFDSTWDFCSARVNFFYHKNSSIYSSTYFTTWKLHFSLKCNKRR